MAKCNYKFPFDCTSEELYSKMKDLMEQKGGSIQGDAVQGTISFDVPIFGHINGIYSIANQEISIEILKKPFLVSCNNIESEIRKALFN
jgi:hypothetical protein